MVKKIIKFLSLFCFLFVSILIFLIFIIDKNFFDLKDKLYLQYPNLKTAKYVFSKKKNINLNLDNDYNVKFLPHTQFEKLQILKKKINFQKEYFVNKDKFQDTTSYKRYGSFFLDIYKSDLILSDYLGNFYLKKDFSNFLTIDQSFKFELIKNNLNALRVFDIYVNNREIYVSYTIKDKNCHKIKVSYAEINYDFLDFKDLFHPEICNETGSPGKIHFWTINDKKGILLSTADGEADKPGLNSQNNDSIFGKILFLPFDKSRYQIFSKGHRVIQGLEIYNNIIISTEHGPRGGDEINKIELNGNYGWPIASYGERYDFNYSNLFSGYLKSHSLNGFKEPLFTFIPSVGISEIIKLPKDFSIFYDDHYLLSTLNDRSIYFLRLDSANNKLFSLEKVFIGQRIRDAKYFEDKNLIILALEENGEIAFLYKD